MSAPENGIINLYYTHLWNTMVIREEWKLQAMNVARKIVAHKEQYRALCAEANPKMPWYFPGIIHQLECSGNFNLHLHNGDPLSARTVRVPKGRPLQGKGPFTWQASAVDAVKLEGFSEFDSWSLAELLYRFEKYNGFGYRSKGIFSPYIWSGTNHYEKGKYVEDSHYDAEAVSRQVGCAVLLRFVTDKTLGIAK